MSFDYKHLTGTSFVDRLCCLCFVYVVLSHLFVGALWSPAEEG